MFSFFKRFKTDPKEQLRGMLAGYTLPSFPGAVTETLQRIRNPESSAASIAEVLSSDPGMSVRVLRVANSAAFSPTKKVENLTQAVALVGLSQVESLVLSVGVGAVMPNGPSQGYDIKRFWYAAARRGLLARGFASLLCPARTSECFTAGFLQDMALPFLAHHRAEEYGPLLEQWHVSGGDLALQERDKLGQDHAEIATWLCSEWDLPENIASAIGGHHDPQNKAYDCPPPVALVAWIRESEEDSGVESLIEAAHAHYGLPVEKVNELVESSFRDADEFAKLMV